MKAVSPPGRQSCIGTHRDIQFWTLGEEFWKNSEGFALSWFYVILCVHCWAWLNAAPKVIANTYWEQINHEDFRQITVVKIFPPLLSPGL